MNDFWASKMLPLGDETKKLSIFSSDNYPENNRFSLIVCERVKSIYFRLDIYHLTAHVKEGNRNQRRKL